MRHMLALMVLVMLVSCGGAETPLPPPEQNPGPPAPAPPQPSQADLELLAAVEARLVKTEGRDRYSYMTPPESGVKWYGTFYATALNGIVHIGTGTIDRDFHVIMGTQGAKAPPVTFNGTLAVSGKISGTLDTGQSLTMYPTATAGDYTQEQFEEVVLIPYP